MPIQLDWRKALAAIGWSLFLTISIVMWSFCCSAKPITLASHQYDNHQANDSVTIGKNDLNGARNLSDSMEMGYLSNNTAAAHALQANATAPTNTDVTHRIAVDTIKAIFLNSNFTNKLNVSPTTDSNDHRTLTEIKSKIALNDRDATETASSMNLPKNRSSTSATELNLDSMYEVKQEKFETNESPSTRQTTTTNAKINDQTNAPTIAHSEDTNGDKRDALKSSNLIKSAAEISQIHANETLSSHSTFATTHQSSITEATTQTSATASTSATTIQSVFLEYSTNFNGTNSRRFDTIHEGYDGSRGKGDHSKSDDDSRRDGSDKNTIAKKNAVDDEAVLSRTERSVHLTPNNSSKRKRPLRNDTANVERIERSANLSLSKANKRIQILIKSRFLQLLPDGTVNGTQNDESEYSKLTNFIFSYFFFI